MSRRPRLVALVSSFSALALLPVAALPFARLGEAGQFLASSWSTFATSRVLASDGSLIAKLHGEVNREPVPLEQIPTNVRDAVIAIEDKRFWEHDGVDPRGIVRAAVENLSSGGLQGGSTISQQLVKNVYLRGEPRNFVRKGVEAFLALGLEKATTKEKILEAYLNTVYFGRGVYGVQAAAESFFHKDVSDLSLGEGAFLAGLIHMPGRYDWAITDDLQSRAAKERALERRNLVLDVMASQRRITRRAAEAAARPTLEIKPPADKRWRHPYFIDAVLRELGVLRNRGESRPDRRFDFLGTTYEERAEAVYRRGLRIHTTLDPVVQSSAERGLSDQLPAGSLPKLSAAAVSVEPRSGFVRALIGGRDYYPEGCEDATAESAPSVCRHAKVNLALGSAAGGSGRHAGSAFKPFVLAAALEDGISLRQQVRSSPFTVEYEGSRWKVENYDGSGSGNMSIVDATVRSVNAAFARLEVDYLGDGKPLQGSRKVAAVARKLGFPFPTTEEVREMCGDRYNQGGDCTPADNVPAIALGAKEVSPLRMAAAYAGFAAEGMYAAPTTIAKIEDASGKLLYEAKPEARRVIKRSTARGVSHVLQQAVDRGTGRRAALERPVAGKTGTSQQWRDAWFAGYVPQLASVVWVGNPLLARNRQGHATLESLTPANGYPTRIVGGTYPARIWGTFMGEATRDLPVESFPEPPEDVFKKPEPPKHEERDERVGGVMGLGRAEARIALQRAGHRVIVISECPPGGSDGGGMRVWKQEVAPDGTIMLYVSRAVCR